MIVAVKIASNLQDCGVTPWGTGIRRIASGKSNTTPQRTIVFLEEGFSASILGESGCWDSDGCSTQWSFKELAYSLLASAFELCILELARLSSKTKVPRPKTIPAIYSIIGFELIQTVSGSR